MTSAKAPTLSAAPTTPFRFIDERGAEDWGRLSKRAVGEKLAERIAAFLTRPAAE
jgi:hypothetical protein